MFHGNCHRKHKHGLMGLMIISIAMTIPLIYYAMDIAHSLRVLAHKDDLL
jgi:hypothetical protein